MVIGPAIDPITEHWKYKQERNRRKRRRFLKACKRDGVATFMNPCAVRFSGDYRNGPVSHW